MTDNHIASVQSALRLLSILAGQPNIGLSELARLARMNKSRVYRLLCTLDALNFIQRTGDPVVYRLGQQLLVLGVSAASQIDLIGAAEPVIDQLSQQFDENLQLRIRDGDETVQILRRVSQKPLQVHSSAGNRRPLGRGASGRLLLAYAPEHIRQAVLAQQPDLHLDLAQLRALAFSKTEGELTDGIFAFAAAIFNVDGQCIASLSLSAPRSRIDDATEQAISQAISQQAKRISARLGYLPLSQQEE